MPPLSKGTRIGPFIVIEPMSKGGMAQIYRARMPVLHQDVAVKVSLSEGNGRLPQNNNALRLEVDILTRLNHPGVIRILRVPLESAKEQPYMACARNLQGAPWYYAMEYLGGGSLGSILKETHRLPFSLASAVGYKLIDAIQYIHSRDIVHLDIKPENVLMRFPLTKGAVIEPVLIDFGVAAHTKQINASGGTLVTMAPEYIRKVRGEMDPQLRIDLEKVDVYALGVVVFRLWTGQYPFGGITNGSLTSNILHGTIQRPRTLNPELPPQTDELMHAWLSKDPVARPTLDELQKELKYFAAGLTHVPESIIPQKKKGLFGFGR